ncbi:Mrp2 [Kluyveromyces lactis]|uniref:37S ribosomal protein MRP2, mitochondrial n=1 Tax=Kluyveromyces lactis (strain ATCC 8585 / CBS 2359 / DSM 70799 / NBRC 1267 / NRRL Y-1140 / WM37) TaxID=284590 RepID=Q6CVN6_KLULA|nr:mitochondrial 37S ribosomal protein MRP2 [Kluyveromyces lactis]QEU61785.1 Mrp2 [Kluyveromyces lactis]CAH02396.1 KLLA0B10648p [Kluyveromyces lactis]|eukprot:XP_452003.1 mitochondrial 37S ribosomal protein MRP2 [Kluyveromyces lactis]
MGGFRFPIKTKLPSTYLNARVIRDNFKRQQVADNEVTVKALKFIARNTTLPPRSRMEAQLQLSVMPNYTRMTQIKNRCIETGHSRSVLSDFRLCRSQFRELARKGDLPGVKKGVW